MSPYREDPSAPVPLKWRLADAWDWLVRHRVTYMWMTVAVVAMWAAHAGVMAVVGCDERDDACQAECMASESTNRYKRVAGRCFCSTDQWVTWTEVQP